MLIRLFWKQQFPVLDAGNAPSQKEQCDNKKTPNQTKIQVVSLRDSWFSAFPKDFPQVKQLLSILKWSGADFPFAVTCYSVHAGNLTHEVMFHLQLLMLGVYKNALVQASSCLTLYFMNCQRWKRCYLSII